MKRILLFLLIALYLGTSLLSGSGSETYRVKNILLVDKNTAAITVNIKSVDPATKNRLLRRLYSQQMTLIADKYIDREHSKAALLLYFLAIKFDPDNVRAASSLLKLSKSDDQAVSLAAKTAIKKIISFLSSPPVYPNDNLYTPVKAFFPSIDESPFTPGVKLRNGKLLINQEKRLKRNNKLWKSVLDILSQLVFRKSLSHGNSASRHRSSHALLELVDEEFFRGRPFTALSRLALALVRQRTWSRVFDERLNLCIESISTSDIVKNDEIDQAIAEAGASKFIGAYLKRETPHILHLPKKE